MKEHITEEMSVAMEQDPSFRRVLSNVNFWDLFSADMPEKKRLFIVYRFLGFHSLLSFLCSLSMTLLASFSFSFSSSENLVFLCFFLLFLFFFSEQYSVKGKKESKESVLFRSYGKQIYSLIPRTLEYIANKKTSLIYFLLSGMLSWILNFSTNFCSSHRSGKQSF